MKISIITTCYNSASTINETILSVLSQQQSGFELEYIITDAGSTDQTLELIKSYGQKLIYVNAKGTSQSEGINLGFELATGDIIAFLNSDDIYLPGALLQVAESFKNNPNFSWLVGGCKIIDESGIEMQSWISTYKEFLRSNYSYFLLLTENFICQPAVFFRKSIYQEFGGLSTSENYVMDYEYWLRIAKKYPPLNIKETLAGFRRMASTKSNSGYRQQFYDDLRVGVRYAIDTRTYIAIPVKCVNYLKVIFIYSFLYRKG